MHEFVRNRKQMYKQTVHKFIFVLGWTLKKKKSTGVGNTASSGH